jgi:hypothetical protein
MESITVVRCPGCGYDGNNPFFRYCGICGAALQKDAQAATAGARPSKVPGKAATKAPSKALPLTISSFSILGLQDETPLSELRADEAPESPSRPDEPSFHLKSGRDPEPSRYADYLLEDDEPRPVRWSLYVVLAGLVISAAALAWQWQRDGSPFIFLSAVINPAKHSVPAQEAASVPDNSSATAAPPVTAPAAAADSTSVADKTETPSAQSVPETPSTSSSPEKQAPVAAPPQSANASEPVAPPLEDHHAAAVENPPALTGMKPTGAKPVDASPSASTVVSSNLAGSNSDSETPAAAQPASIPAADLLAEGQKYLYGDGVVKDCGRALQDLRTAARTNAEAASLLGTMYASGHCVGRNLAPAYHWYARALHREPGNTRFQSDLEVLWKQMTPEDRRAALRITP